MECQRRLNPLIIELHMIQLQWIIIHWALQIVMEFPQFNGFVPILHSIQLSKIKNKPIFHKNISRGFVPIRHSIQLSKIKKQTFIPQKYLQRFCPHSARLTTNQNKITPLFHKNISPRLSFLASVFNLYLLICIILNDYFATNVHTTASHQEATDVFTERSVFLIVSNPNIFSKFPNHV